jgi:Cu(I)/Ag(I) efflux system periplasmic protein CusF
MRFARMFSSRPVYAAFAAALAISVAPACSRSQDAGERAVPSAAGKATYSTRGKVRAIGEKKDSITIAHEDIPNFMKAMTMMFEVEKPETVANFNVGDAVSFTFSDRDGRLFIESITKSAQ